MFGSGLTKIQLCGNMHMTKICDTNWVWNIFPFITIFCFVCVLTLLASLLGSSKKDPHSVSALEASQLNSLNFLSPFGGFMPGMDPGLLPLMYPGMPGLMGPGMPPMPPGLMPGQLSLREYA